MLLKRGVQKGHFFPNWLINKLFHCECLRNGEADSAGFSSLGGGHGLGCPVGMRDCGLGLQSVVLWYAHLMAHRNSGFYLVFLCKPQ